MMLSTYQLLRVLGVAATFSQIGMAAPYYHPPTASNTSTRSTNLTQPGGLDLFQNSSTLLNGGYWPEWKGHFDDSCVDLKTVSHINYAFASISDTGELIVGDAENLRALVQRKATYPGLKIYLAVGGGHESASKQFEAIASELVLLDAFIKSASKTVEEYNLDGIDIDWEYPDNYVEGNQFLHLMQRLRMALPSPLRVSAALPVGDWILQHIDLKKLAKQVDYLNLMAYDFVGATFANVVLTGHHAKLLDTSTGGPSVSAAVQYVTAAGFPANKIMLGIPLYGRSFGGAEWVGKPFSGTGRNSEIEVKDLPPPGLKEYYDEEAVGIFAVGNGEFWTYDNKHSVAEKAKFARQKGLAGLFYWQLGGDRCGQDSLVRAGYEALRNNGTSTAQ